MALISIMEVVDIIIMSLFLGYLFHDLIKLPKKPTEMLIQKGFDWESYKFTTLCIAPSIIIHELAHKFVAMGYGMQATFHAFYAQSFTFLLGMFAIAAKIFSLGFFLIVPGFVSIQGTGTPLTFALIAFAGPAVHLVFWGISKLIIKSKPNLKGKTKLFILVTEKINLFLFIFNMLPIPGFDGFSVYSNLLTAFF